MERSLLNCWHRGAGDPLTANGEAARRFNKDDFGTHLRQELRAKQGAGVPAEVDDGEAFEGEYQGITSSGLRPC